MRTVGKIAYIAFVVALVGVAGVFLASLLPIPGNIELKIVKSGSMEPTIKTGAVVIVKPLAIESYQVGDIVTFGEDTTRQIPTTHRIVSVETVENRIAFMTKGDANEEADPQQVPADEVIGKVIFNVPFAGYILDFARQPLGFALLIGIPAGIVIIDESFRIFGEIKKMRAKKREDVAKTEQHNEQQV